jgi:thiamine-phosphate pyrophosphorylase
MAESCLLYYLTDRTAFATDEPSRRRLLLEKIAEAVRAGVDYVQLREKDLSIRELESLAREAVDIIAKVGKDNQESRTALLINSRTDMALATGADGVHLRSVDISPQEVRAIWKSGAGAAARENQSRSPLVAVSCHLQAELTQAEAQDASFAVFGPVFEKKDAMPAGLTRLREACQAKMPVLALGGITVANARSCLEAGAAGIAGIRLFQENNMLALVRQFRD